MEDKSKNDSIPDKEKTLLRLAADANYPGAVKPCGWPMIVGGSKGGVGKSKLAL